MAIRMIPGVVAGSVPRRIVSDFFFFFSSQCTQSFHELTNTNLCTRPEVNAKGHVMSQKAAISIFNGASFRSVFSLESFSAATPKTIGVVSSPFQQRLPLTNVFLLSALFLGDG
jgi:hypothetical protein